MSRIPGSGLKTWGGRYMTGGHYRVAKLFSRRPQRGQWRNYGSTRSKATRALRLIRKFKKEQEVKYIDTTGTCTIAYASSNTWQTAGRILLNACSQGDTALTRDGNKTSMQDLTIRFIFNGGATDDDGRVWRLVIFYDRKPAGAVPGPTDIFQTDHINAPLAKKNAGRFAILYDGYIAQDSTQFHSPLKLYMKLNRVSKVDYGIGNAGTIADISKGALYFWANGAALDTADSSITYYSRVKFTDS